MSDLSDSPTGNLGPVLYALFSRLMANDAVVRDANSERKEIYREAKELYGLNARAIKEAYRRWKQDPKQSEVVGEYMRALGEHPIFIRAQTDRPSDIAGADVFPSDLPDDF